MSPVIIEQQPAGVVLVRICRPEARNALNIAIREQLCQAFIDLNSNDEVRCIVLTGGEKVFVSGADLRDMAELGAIEMLRRGHRMWQAITDCAKPIIAAVNGYAWGGGCELAMHADIIIAGEGASFCQPEVKVGIMPGAGGTQRLARAVGKYQAMKMVLTGHPVMATEALAIGMVSEVVPDDQTLATSLRMASQIACMPPLAVAQIKEVMLAGQDMSLDAALCLERKAFQLLFDSQDQKEGMAAFLEKRQPDFRGK